MRTKHQLILDSSTDDLARKLLEIDDHPEYIPQETKDHLKYENNYTCAICGRKTLHLHIDHKIPLCQNGKCYIDNLQVLCAFCNLSKSGHSLDPRSYKVGYVIPIHRKTENQINSLVLEKLNNELA